MPSSTNNLEFLCLLYFFINSAKYCQTDAFVSFWVERNPYFVMKIHLDPRKVIFS